MCVWVFKKNVKQSPAPVCMFYFAHPFGGIATPSSTSYSIDPYAGMPTASKTPNSKRTNPPNQMNQQHLNDFTPWPRQTWQQSRDVLSPLIQALQRQIGKRFFSVYITCMHDLLVIVACYCNS